MSTKIFRVGGMTCAACQAHVDKAVCSLAGVNDVSVNLLSGSMTVDYDESLVDADKIVSAVEGLGYGARIDDVSAQPAQAEQKKATTSAMTVRRSIIRLLNKEKVA